MHIVAAGFRVLMDAFYGHLAINPHMTLGDPVTLHQTKLGDCVILEKRGHLILSGFEQDWIEC